MARVTRLQNREQRLDQKMLDSIREELAELTPDSLDSLFIFYVKKSENGENEMAAHACKLSWESIGIVQCMIDRMKHQMYDEVLGGYEEEIRDD